MAIMNLLTKEKRTHRHSEQTYGCMGGRGVGEGWTGNLGLAECKVLVCRMDKQQGPTV